MTRYSFVAALLFLGSCAMNGISDETLQTDAARLAQLQCEAKKLQEERFKLATDIRLLEDSVIAAQDTALKTGYQTKLDELSSHKDDMWRRTKAMADSITHVLEGYYQGTYKDTADRKLLDVALNVKFEEICK